MVFSEYVESMYKECELSLIQYENAILTAEENYDLINSYNDIFTESKSDNKKSFIDYINKLIESFRNLADSIMDKIHNIISKNEVDPNRNYISYEDTLKLQDEASIINEESKSLIRKILEKKDVSDGQIDTIVTQVANFVKFEPSIQKQALIKKGVARSNEAMYRRQHDLNRDLYAIGELCKRANDERISDYERNRIKRLQKASMDATKHSLEGCARRAIGLPSHQTKVYKTGETYHWTNKKR